MYVASILRHVPRSGLAAAPSLRYQRWYASQVTSCKACQREPGCSSRMPYSVMVCVRVDVVNSEVMPSRIP